MQSFASIAIYLFQLLWNKWPSHKIYHVYTHDNLQTYKTIRSAKELLILHAAFYHPSETAKAIVKALRGQIEA